MQYTMVNELRRKKIETPSRLTRCQAMTQHTAGEHKRPVFEDILSIIESYVAVIMPHIVSYYAE